MKRKILLSGGGTGGSVAPLLAVADQLRRMDSEIEFLMVGTERGPERAMAEAAGIPYRAIPSGKLRRYFSWKNISDLVNILRGFLAAQRLVRSWRPDTVMSAGSFVSVPVVWAAKLQGCKIHIHQQDVIPGLANRLMSRAASVITVSFEKSLNDFPRSKTRLTGNPVRPSILSGKVEEARRIFSLESGTPVVVIIGGGTGAVFLNHLIGVAAYKLVKYAQVIHVTGVNREYVRLEDPRYHQYEFLSGDLPHAFAAADLVISRAGLGAMTELAALGKPAIFIPMPHTHQVANAAYYAERQAGLMLDQNTLTPETFVHTVEELLRQPDRLRALGNNIHHMYRPDALVQLTDIVLHLSDV